MNPHWTRPCIASIGVAGTVIGIVLAAGHLGGAPPATNSPGTTTAPASVPMSHASPMRHTASLPPGSPHVAAHTRTAPRVPTTSSRPTLRPARGRPPCRSIRSHRSATRNPDNPGTLRHRMGLAREPHLADRTATHARIGARLQRSRAQRQPGQRASHDYQPGTMTFVANDPNVTINGQTIVFHETDTTPPLCM